MNDKLTITKMHEWDMGHRLGDGYTSKCKHLHGHRYKLEITLACQQLDLYGMVQDFGTIKQLLGGWIDENIDHACIVSTRDASLFKFLKAGKQRYYSVEFNTTVENLVVWLAGKLQTVLDRHLAQTITDAEVSSAEDLAVAKEVCENYASGGCMDAASIRAERRRNGRALSKADTNFILRDAGRALTITHLRLYETPNGFADWYKKEPPCSK